MVYWFLEDLHLSAYSAWVDLLLQVHAESLSSHETPPIRG